MLTIFLWSNAWFSCIDGVAGIMPIITCPSCNSTNTRFCHEKGFVENTRFCHKTGFIANTRLFGFVWCRLLRRYLGFDLDFAQISGLKTGGWHLCSPHQLYNSCWIFKVWQSSKPSQGFWLPSNQVSQKQYFMLCLGTPCRGGHFRGRAVLWLPLRPLSYPAILLWVNKDSNIIVWSVTILMFPEMQGSLGALATTEDRRSSWREHKSPLCQDRQQFLEWGLQVWS